MKKQIAILGSTGSIGTQALQVIENHSDLYEVYVLTANNNVELLIEQARKFHPEVVIIANKNKYSQLKEALNDLPVKIYAGMDAICQVVESSPIDIVLTAMVGYAGLRPTITGRFGTFGDFSMFRSKQSDRKDYFDSIWRSF